MYERRSREGEAEEVNIAYRDQDNEKREDGYDGRRAAERDMSKIKY